VVAKADHSISEPVKKRFKNDEEMGRKFDEEKNCTIQEVLIRSTLVTCRTILNSRGAKATTVRANRIGPNIKPCNVASYIPFSERS